MRSGRRSAHTVLRAFRHYRQGFALPMVVVLTGILAVVTALFLHELQVSAEVTSHVMERRRTFYAADGMMRAAMVEANRYLRSNASASSADVKAHFTTALLNQITPSGYTRESWDITTGGVSTGPLPNGPFEGMMARQYPLELSVQLRSGSGMSAASTSSSVTLGQVSAFQFFMFVDMSADWWSYPTTNIGGRSHANGDFCIGGNSGSHYQWLTASGRIKNIKGEPGSICGYSPSVEKAYVAVKGTCNLSAAFPTGCTTLKLEPANDNGCTTCSYGGATGWKDYATKRWNGAIQDKAHGVPRMNLPITGIPRVQAGVSAKVANVGEAGDKHSNIETSKFLVDPVVPAEPTDVREQKLYYKADIRIINGVWYLRDVGSPEQPGTPIWSDHPGQFNYDPSADGLVGSSQSVGQSDLFGASARPSLYSYYETDTSHKLTSDKRGVISYGTLYRSSWTPPATHAPSHTTANAAIWHPGYRYLYDAATASHLHHYCGDADNDSATNPEGDRNDKTQVFMGDALTDADWCNNGPAASPVPSPTTLGGPTDYAVDSRSNILEATRSGIKNGHASHGLPPNSITAAKERRARILPANFDVAAFQAALGSSGSGELGDVFSSAGRAFNGIVYITYTWPGWQSGFSSTADGFSGRWPNQGAQTDGNQFSPHGSSPVVASSEANLGQQALPYPLCSNHAGTIGSPYDTATGRFVVANCSGNSNNARPNAIRVINGHYLNPTSAKTLPSPHPAIPAGQLPNGLTIVTNLPIYVLGEYNTNSLETENVPITGAHWTASLIAGDNLVFLSNAWDDKRTRWDLDVPDCQWNNAKYHRKVTSPTVYQSAFLIGWAPSYDGVRGPGVHNFMTNIEDWKNPSANPQYIRGAVVIGFYSTFSRWAFVHTSPVSGISRIFRAPTRPWHYDKHYDNLDNQPPGAPEYAVSAVRTWRRN